MMPIREKYTDIIKEANDSLSEATVLFIRSHILDNGFTLYFVYDKSSKFRSLYLPIDKIIHSSRLPHWRGIAFANVQVSLKSTNHTLFLRCEENKETDLEIFYFFVKNCCETLGRANIHNMEPALFNFLEKWKHFFVKNKKLTLSPEEQQGLYGELLFLQECINHMGTSAVKNWIGSEKEPHDFYFGDTAVEVKTTISPEPYKARISNSYQLDTSEVDGSLYLSFYALAKRTQGDDDTLNDLVDLLRLVLQEDDHALAQLNDKLITYGYLDEMRENYTEHYYLRHQYIFLVDDTFPRITLDAIPHGVSRLSYDINITQCLSHEQRLDSVLHILQEK